MSVLITGGTGTIGRAIVRQAISDKYNGRIVLYSRDEAKHASAAEEFTGHDNIRYITGDICDYEKLLFAMKGIDSVIHAAAMKRIDTCEYDIVESTKINIHGTENVAKACVKSSVCKAMFISTDKACNPCSAYGAQKYAAERIWIGMNNFTDKTMFNVVRYGNVIASRGSVFEKWERLAEEGMKLSVTHENMTRFFWSKEEAADFIVRVMADANDNNERGMVFVPKMEGKNILEMALSISDDIDITGLRCPEKLHEEMISSVESLSTYDCGDYYMIAPSFHEWAKSIKTRGRKVKPGFTLTSEIK